LLGDAQPDTASFLVGVVGVESIERDVQAVEMLLGYAWAVVAYLDGYVVTWFR
jgi:hypothetical protein